MDFSTTQLMKTKQILQKKFNPDRNPDPPGQSQLKKSIDILMGKQ